MGFLEIAAVAIVVYIMMVKGAEFQKNVEWKPEKNVRSWRKKHLINKAEEETQNELAEDPAANEEGGPAEIAKKAMMMGGRLKPEMAKKSPMVGLSEGGETLEMAGDETLFGDDAEGKDESEDDAGCVEGLVAKFDETFPSAKVKDLFEVFFIF